MANIKQKTLLSRHPTYLLKKFVFRWFFRLVLIFLIFLSGIIAGLTHHAPINFTLALKWEGAK